MRFPKGHPFQQECFKLFLTDFDYHNTKWTINGPDLTNVGFNRIDNKEIYLIPSELLNLYAVRGVAKRLFDQKLNMQEIKVA